MKKKTLVYIAPHLSTGGLPQYLFKQIESVINDFDVYCIEWDNITGGVLVIQRNRIANILKDKLITLGESKANLFKILDRIKPDVVHLQEIPEMFMGEEIADRLYASTRTYTIIETSHDSSYNIDGKRYIPDKFLMVSNYQVQQYKSLGVPIDLVEYPIEQKIRTKTREQALRDLGLDPNLKHVINVGLFTPRKNQAEVIEYARQLQHYPIQFHFIGNQADNFKYYWEPLMQSFPKNCKWWGERDDIDSFYEAADLFLFTSKGNSHDKETMPLVIREALSWKTPSLIYNLPVYMGYFDKYDSIEYLQEDTQKNGYKIAEKLLRENNITISSDSKDEVFYTQNGEQKLARINYHNDTSMNIATYGEQAAQYWYTFIFKELDRGGIEIEPGDVFVDLGGNIGMSSKYAVSKGAKEIHTFEPDPDMCELIRKNVPSAIIHRYAISDKFGEMELYHWPYNPVNIGPKYTSKTITLNEVLSVVGKRIDYLKVDIEGSETTVFDTLTPKDCSQIDKMMVEYHHNTGLDDFCAKLERLGFSLLYVDRGHQSFIYAKYTGVKGIKFHSRWDLSTQTIYFSSETDIRYPILVSLKEYKTNSVLWSNVIDSLPANSEYWMLPVAKHIHSYEHDVNFTGVKICIYDKETEEQLYEHPYVHTFVNMPTLALSNSIPYHFNYLEYFIHKKYSRWLDRPYKTVVDVGANVGVFSSYMIMNNYATKIIAIECDKVAVKDLQRNFKHNTTVTVVAKALHTSTEPISFYHSPDNPVISSTLAPDTIELHRAGIKGNVKDLVPTVTLQQLVEEYGEIDLLKIDIEGAEYDIIENTDQTIFNKINNIFLECHFFKNEYKKQYSNLIKKLKSMGYSIEEYKQNQVNDPELQGGSECIFATKGIRTI